MSARLARLASGFALALCACENPTAPDRAAAPPPPPSRRVVATSSIIDLGLPSGTTALQAYGVNANGDIVGYGTDKNGKTKGFVWSNDVFRTLAPIKSYRESFAFSMNDGGKAAGISQHASGRYRATLWNADGSTRDLGVLTSGGDSYGMAVSYLGSVAGSATVADGSLHGFYWSSFTGRMTDIGILPGGSYSLGQDLNDWGQITGYADTPAGDRAFLWSVWTGAMTELGTIPGGASSYALSINNSSQVVGFAFTAAGWPHAFFWDGGPMQDLGTLGGDQSVAFGINDQGEVVGYSQVASGEFHAFVWTAASGMVDLGTLPGGVISYAQSINANGQTAGIGEAADGTPHAVRWQVTLR